MKVPAAVRAIDSEPLVFTGDQQRSRAAVQAAETREVLEAAKKFQDDSARAGAKPRRRRCDPRKTYSTAYSTPHVSVGAGCHSSQVNEFNELYKRHGIIGAEHRADGTLESTSKRAFNRVLEVRGLFNRDAGYGDFAGNSRE